MMDDDIFNTDKAPEETKEIKLDDDDDDDPFSLASSKMAAAAAEPAAETLDLSPPAVAPSTINIQPALQEEPAEASPPPAVVSSIKKPVMK